MSKNKHSGNSLLDFLSEEQRKALLSASTHKQKMDEKASNKIVLVDTPEKLKACEEQLAAYQQIAVDLEFDDNRFTYGRNICLIQIQGGSTSWIIDTIKIPHPACILKVFENNQVRKIFNSCSSDIGLLQDIYKCYPKNIEDTSLMYKFLLESEATPSLAKLLQEKIGVVLTKDEQTSDWNKRPLTLSQIQYAANDVIYLEDLYNKLKEELIAVGRWEWYEQERKELENTVFLPSDFLERHIHKYKVIGKAAFLYRQYWKIVDDFAQQINLPHYKVVSTQFLTDLAKNPPTSLEEWRKVKGFHPKLKTDNWLSRFYETTADVEKNYKKLEEERAVLRYLTQQLEKISEAFVVTFDKKLRNEFYELIKQKLLEKKGEMLQNIILSTKAKDEIILSGFSSLTLWKQEMIKKVCQEENIEEEPIWHSLMYHF
ncbi:MAG: ribonuclease D [Flammeovirgaceae bacterium]|nr:ribonuclease D [Flammeovirgaceae bacterium]MDW8287325.1 ribonuclease D [Flammeovirgaceae bacterium]